MTSGILDRAARLLERYKRSPSPELLVRARRLLDRAQIELATAAAERLPRKVEMAIGEARSEAFWMWWGRLERELDRMPTQDEVRAKMLELNKLVDACPAVKETRAEAAAAARAGNALRLRVRVAALRQRAPVVRRSPARPRASRSPRVRASVCPYSLDSPSPDPSAPRCGASGEVPVDAVGDPRGRVAWCGRCARAIDRPVREVRP